MGPYEKKGKDAVHWGGGSNSNFHVDRVKTKCQRFFPSHQIWPTAPFVLVCFWYYSLKYHGTQSSVLSTLVGDTTKKGYPGILKYQWFDCITNYWIPLAQEIQLYFWGQEHTKRESPEEISTIKIISSIDTELQCQWLGITKNLVASSSVWVSAAAGNVMHVISLSLSLSLSLSWSREWLGPGSEPWPMPRRADDDHANYPLPGRQQQRCPTTTLFDSIYGF